MEQDNFNLNSETRLLFKSTANWMRIYSILLLIATGIGLLAVLLMSSMKGAEIDGEMLDGVDPNMIPFIQDIFGFLIIAIAILLMLLGYAAINLLKAGNSFTAISYHPKSSEFIKSIKNLTAYWKIYGFVIILFALVIVYILIKAIVFAQSIAETQG